MTGNGTFIRHSAATIVLAGACVTAGCASPQEPAPRASFASATEAFASAEQTYALYTRALDEVDFARPDSFETALSFTTGALNEIDREFLMRMSAEGNTKVGESYVRSFHGVRYTHASGTQVVAMACIDQSDVDLLDANGRSIIAANRPDFYTMRLTFVLKNGRLLLRMSIPVSDAPCDEE